MQKPLSFMRNNDKQEPPKAGKISTTPKGPTPFVNTQ